MWTLRTARRLAVACAVALFTPWISQVIQGQGRQADPGPSIQSLSEPSQALAIRGSSSKTGLVTFASSAGGGILLPLAPSLPAQDRALGFIDLYGAPFGITDRAQLELQRASQTDELGIDHVRFQQVHNGIPVRGGEFVVHMRGSRVTAANGLVVKDMPSDVTPNLTGGGGQDVARRLIAKYHANEAADVEYGTPRLEIFNRGVMDEGIYPSKLAWFVEATGPTLREFIWIDAHTGVLLLHFSQLTEALSRKVYTSNHTATLPGTLLRSEGGAATGDPDADNAYTFAGITYNYYLTNHNRDSFDNAGGVITSSVHYCPAGQCPAYANAFWNGSQMVYGDTYASADDVVGHELTHAVTERTAGLLYYNQSGAMNESFSDIFGETIDLTDGVGNDSAGVRWMMGEDLPIGAIRNMMNPNQFNDPGKMSDSLYFKCATQAWTDPLTDHGGVHSNSGIPNHAYALMVDGGTYNGQTITGIGTTKAAKIEYRALTTYLTSGSGFLDDFNALNQSCTDLIGTVGITAADCTQVNKALLAVQMNAVWGCTGAVLTPAMCPAGTNPSFLFQDSFEAVTSNWTPSTATAPPPSPGIAGSWTARDNGLARNGVYMAYGTDVDNRSDHRLAMSSNVALPSASRLYFDSAFEFESAGSTAYDGGVLEYSTNSGSTWLDAGTLIDAGQAYNGTITTTSDNPLGGRSGFVITSYGYTGTRLSLASLSGQNVRFRFRIGTDTGTDSLGWAVDNFGIYTCVTTPTNTPPSITTNPASTTVLTGTTIFLSANATGTPTPTAQWQVSTNGGSSWANIPGATSFNLSFAAQRFDNGKQYRAVFTNSAGVANTAAATLQVRLRVRTDLDGDRKSDLMVWRPANGYWFWLTSSSSFNVGSAGQKQWGSGANNDIPLSGDMDGDGIADLVLWRPADGTFYWLTSSSGYNYASQAQKQWGSNAQGDIPMLGDIDGDGHADLIVWRPGSGTWFYLLSSSGYSYATSGSKQWGNGGLGDKPLIADLDGDGLVDFTVWRASTGTWFWLLSTTSYTFAGQKQWGNSALGDIPLVADMDADGVSDLVVWRPSAGTFFWLTSLSGYNYAAQVQKQWGSNAQGDIPMLGDIDGDGGADLIVWRPGSGTWFWLTSSSGYNYAAQGQKQWGASGDVPLIK